MMKPFTTLPVRVAAILLFAVSCAGSYEVTFHSEKNVITLAQLRGDHEYDLRLYNGRTIDLPKGHYTLIVFPEKCRIYENAYAYKTQEYVNVDDRYVVQEVTYVVHPETFSFKVNGDAQVEYYVPVTPNVVNREFKSVQDKANAQAAK